MIVEFPYRASRRAFARRPRRSKNGTPDERAAAAAQAATTAATDPVRKQRRSKNGTPEERAVRKALLATPIDLTASRAKRVERAMASRPRPMTPDEFAAAYLAATPTQQTILRTMMEEAVEQNSWPNPPAA
jgi:hypothetical protein